MRFDRKVFIEGYKAGYKKAMQVLFESAEEGSQNLSEMIERLKEYLLRNKRGYWRKECVGTYFSRTHEEAKGFIELCKGFGQNAIPSLCIEVETSLHDYDLHYKTTNENHFFEFEDIVSIEIINNHTIIRFRRGQKFDLPFAI